MPSVSGTSPAFSYIRFSSPKQAEGDSLRRQTDKAADWCKRNHARLDTSLTLHDLGRSAFTGEHRENPDRNALALFLKLVKQGRVPKDSYLVVESLDRLTREHVQPALLLLLGLLQDGVRIVQLTPVETTYDSKSDAMHVMMMIMELSRGNSESRVKSERCGAAWAEKKRLARGGEVMTGNAPRWFKRDTDGKTAVVRDGKLVPDPARVAVVKRIFKMAADGYGNVTIAKKLKEANVQSFGGRRETWTRSYLGLILKDRRALGEHQPMKNGKPDGSVIPHYYPAVVTEEEWLAARSGRQQRTKTRGRRGKHINIFAGVLKCALDRGPYHMTTWSLSSGKKQRALINFRSVEGLEKCRSFPYDTLEAAVLSQLREVDPSVFSEANSQPSDLAVLSGEQAGIDAELAALAADMETNGYSSTLANRVRVLESRRSKLAEKVADVRQRATCPTGEAWGEVKTLSQLLAAATDPADVRMRLQTALRRVVTEAWMVVVPRGSVRLAAVSLYFGEGEAAPFRTYFVIHRPGVAPGGKLIHSAQWAVLGFKHPDDGLPFNREDLRNEDGASRVQGDLLTYPMGMIEKLLNRQTVPPPKQ